MFTRLRLRMGLRDVCEVSRKHQAICFSSRSRLDWLSATLPRQTRVAAKAGSRFRPVENSLIVGREHLRQHLLRELVVRRAWTRPRRTGRWRSSCLASCSWRAARCGASDWSGLPPPSAVASASGPPRGGGSTAFRAGHSSAWASRSRGVDDAGPVVRRAGQKNTSAAGSDHRLRDRSHAACRFLLIHGGGRLTRAVDAAYTPSLAH